MQITKSRASDDDPLELSVAPERESDLMLTPRRRDRKRLVSVLASDLPLREYWDRCIRTSEATAPIVENVIREAESAASAMVRTTGEKTVNLTRSSRRGERAARRVVNNAQ